MLNVLLCVLVSEGDVWQASWLGTQQSSADSTIQDSTCGVPDTMLNVLLCVLVSEGDVWQASWLATQQSSADSTIQDSTCGVPDTMLNVLLCVLVSGRLTGLLARYPAVFSRFLMVRVEMALLGIQLSLNMMLLERGQCRMSHNNAQLLMERFYEVVLCGSSLLGDMVGVLVFSH